MLFQSLENEITQKSIFSIDFPHLPTINPIRKYTLLYLHCISTSFCKHFFPKQLQNIITNKIKWLFSKLLVLTLDMTCERNDGH